MVKSYLMRHIKCLTFTALPWSAQVLHNNSVMCVSSLTRAHLSCGAACSCGERAGVRRRDENAPWPGSLTSCPVPALWLDRCLGTCTSVNTLPKCRARTHREATHWPASSLHKSHTSWMLDQRLYHISAPVPSMSSDSTCDLPYAPLVIWT